MARKSGGTTTARRALWSIGLLVLLAGTFGMHGLSSHAGGMGPEMHPMTPAAVVSGADAPTPDVPGATIDGVRGVAHSTVAMSAALVQDLTVGDIRTTAMCMAVLAVALAILLRFLGDGPGRLRSRWATTLPRAPMSPERDPDPPSLILLSIQRC